MKAPMILFALLIFSTLSLISKNNYEVTFQPELLNAWRISATGNPTLDDNLFPSDRKPMLYASGLNSPIGMTAAGPFGVFVAEAGTGNNDGQLSFLRPDGSKHTIIKGFPSEKRPDGHIDGITHLEIYQQQLWVVNGVSGLLYYYDLSDYHLTKKAAVASAVPTIDIGKFVSAQQMTEPTGESHLYNLTFDHLGNLYVVDSGANAIIKRDYHGTLSVFATFPEISFIDLETHQKGNAEVVPTGIVFDGYGFLVSSFIGEPYPKGEARVYHLDFDGNIVDEQKGFSNLVDIAKSPATGNHFMALELASTDEAGFQPNSGKLVFFGDQPKAIMENQLNFPNGITFVNEKEILVSSTINGTITRIKLP